MSKLCKTLVKEFQIVFTFDVVDCIPNIQRVLKQQRPISANKGWTQLMLLRLALVRFTAVIASIAANKLCECVQWPDSDEQSHPTRPLFIQNRFVYMRLVSQISFQKKKTLPAWRHDNTVRKVLLFVVVVNRPFENAGYADYLIFKPKPMYIVMTSYISVPARRSIIDARKTLLFFVSLKKHGIAYVFLKWSYIGIYDAKAQ